MATWSKDWKKGKRRGARFELRKFLNNTTPAADAGPLRIVCSTDAPGGNGRPTGTVRA